MEDRRMSEKLILRPVKFDSGSESQSRFHQGWHEPLLNLFAQPVTFPPKVPEVPKLYLVPTPDVLEGEEADSDSVRMPSPLSELPELSDWVGKYVVSLVEICGGNRPIQQLARWTHRSAYQKLLKIMGTWKPLPKIRKFYISQPLEGIAEVTITLRFDQRVRALVLRFEGVEKRWLCTKIELI
jgi:hypothetical protein